MISPVQPIVVTCGRSHEKPCCAQILPTLVSGELAGAMVIVISHIQLTHTCSHQHTHIHTYSFTRTHRYSDFSALHQELKSSFPEEQFPAMPKKVFFGRSQTRSVAQQRMKDLQTYLQVCREMCVCLCALLPPALHVCATNCYTCE